MKQKVMVVFLVAIGLVSIFAMWPVFTDQQVINAQECRIVRIYGGAGEDIKEIRLEPERMIASKGTCVIWVNWVRDDEVKIVFDEGQKCDDMTDAPIWFKPEHVKGCYLTSWVPLGGTSSLRFNQAGTFDFTVETSGGRKVIGSIVVE